MADAMRGQGVITVDTGVGRGAVKALVERCSCLLSRACAIMPCVGETETERETERDTETAQHHVLHRGGETQTLKYLTRIAELAMMVADTFHSFTNKTSVHCDDPQKHQSTSNNTLSPWHCNSMLRAFGYGAGISVAVVDGMMVMHMLRDYYLSLGIPGGTARGSGGGSRTVILKLNPKQCKEYAEALRLHLGSIKMKIILSVGSTYMDQHPQFSRSADASSSALMASPYKVVQSEVQIPCFGSIFNRVTQDHLSDDLQPKTCTTRNDEHVEALQMLYQWHASLILNLPNAFAAAPEHNKSLIARDTSSGESSYTMYQYIPEDAQTDATIDMDVDGNTSTDNLQCSSLAFYEWDVLTSPQTMSANLEWMIAKLRFAEQAKEEAGRTEPESSKSSNALTWFSLTLFGFRDSPIFESGKGNSESKNNNNNTNANSEKCKGTTKKRKKGLNHMLASDLLGFHDTRGDPSLTIFAYTNRRGSNVNGVDDVQFVIFRAQ